MATNGDLARRLLAAASDDEFAARSILRIEGVADTIVGFHAQQATEKAIKAVLSAEETEFPFTHDLERLEQFAKKSGIELPTTLDGIKALTPFARDERYGSEPPLGLDRDQALEWAAEAIAWARSIVEQPNTSPPASEDTPGG